MTDDTNQAPVFFDRGAGDMAIQWTKGGGTKEHAFDMQATTQGIYSIDLKFVQDGDDNGATKDAITFRVSTVSTLLGDRTNMFIDRSQRGLSLDTWYNVTMVFNGDSSALNYDTTGLTDTNTLGGLGVVAAGSADLFIDGNLIQDELAGGLASFTHAGFVTFKSPTTPVIFEMDNFSVSAVPEPSTFALLAGLGCLGVVLYRRRRS